MALACSLSEKASSLSLQRYRELAPWLGDFDERDWFNKAIDVNVKGVKDADNGLLSMLTMMPDKLYWKKGTDKKRPIGSCSRRP